MYQIQKYKNFCIVLVSIIGILKNFSRTPHPRISYITRQILNHYELVLCLTDRSRELDSAFNIQTLVSNLINMRLIDLRGYLKLVSLIKIISLCLAKDFIYIYNIQTKTKTNWEHNFGKVQYEQIFWIPFFFFFFFVVKGFKGAGQRLND